MIHADKPVCLWRAGSPELFTTEKPTLFEDHEVNIDRDKNHFSILLPKNDKGVDKLTGYLDVLVWVYKTEWPVKKKMVCESRK